LRRYLDLHDVPGSGDAVCLGIGDVARQRRSVVLVRDLVLQSRLHLSQYLPRTHTHTHASSQHNVLRTPPTLTLDATALR